MMFSNHRNPLGMFGAGPIEMLAREMTTDLQALREAAIAQAEEQDAAVTVALVTKGISFGELTVAPDGTHDQARCRRRS